MSITLFLPFLFGLIFLVAVARTAFNRPRRQKIDTVIPFVRKLDVSELEVLMDAGEEWSLRHFLAEDAFRVAQHERIRLVGVRALSGQLTRRSPVRLASSSLIECRFH